MANTYNQIYIHLVFAVKYRDGVIDKSWRNELYQYIIGLINNRGHKVYAIGGMSDHIHILVSLSPKQSISELVQEVKRASTLWIKEKKYSFSAGQYFEVKIEYVNLTPAEFAEKMQGFQTRLQAMFEEGHRLEQEIKEQLGRVKYE